MPNQRTSVVKCVKFTEKWRRAIRRRARILKNRVAQYGTSDGTCSAAGIVFVARQSTCNATTSLTPNSYSPHLATSDFRHCSHTKSLLGGQDEDDVVKETVVLTDSIFLRRRDTETGVSRYDKCLNNGGNFYLNFYRMYCSGAVC